MSALNPSEQVGIIGAGTMGAGIAQVAAAAGHRVFLFDAKEGAAEAGLRRVRTGLERLIARGRMRAPDVEALMDRIVPVADLADLADAALIVEAIVEDLEVKRRLFAQLEEIVTEKAILATNTSSISINALARDARHSERIAGLHFFNPAPVMNLVEIVSGLATAPEVAASLFDTAAAWGKIPVRARSTPGFIVNRVARAFYAEPLRLYEEQVSDPVTLDALFTGAGFRMGPFALMDLIGNDVNYAVTRSIYDAYYQEPRFRPSLVQLELVNAGRLGRKSGHGFHDYSAGAVSPQPAYTPVPDAAPFPDFELDRTNQLDGVVIAPTDGRTAAQLSWDQGQPAIVLDSVALTASAMAIAATNDVPAAVLARLVATLQAQGVQVAKLPDWPGLVVTRTIALIANEAFEAVMHGVADAEGVDAAMRNGVNYPQGPIKWAEQIGLDRILAVLDNIFQRTGDPRYRASLALRKLAEQAAHHG